MEKRYTVRQAVTMTGVKSYVLRYWEEELDLRIGRNELGHRYYTPFDIQLFLKINELKNRGLQLKAIRTLIPQEARNTYPSDLAKTGSEILEGEAVEIEDIPVGTPEEAAEDMFMEKQKTSKEHREDDKKILEFQEILERLIHEEMQRKKEGEYRCRSLDEAILKKQQARKKTRLEKLKNKWREQMDTSELVVDEDIIAKTVAMWTKIPVTKIAEAESEKLINLEQTLHNRVIGQDEAVSAVAKAIRRGRVGLKDPNRPIGSFLFLGPTGVGKTELSKALADAMFGTDNSLIRVDMSEYMEKHTVSKLIGSPPGYVGYDEGGQLSEKVRRNPYSVVLFDEVEKAHPDVFNVLLQVLDDGRITDSQGRTVDFKNTIIILTSNIGSTYLLDGIDDKGNIKEGVEELVMGDLRNSFRPEFLNRLDEIIMFKPLNKENIGSIINLLINDVNRRLEDKELKVVLTDSAKDFIVEHGFDPMYGARPLKRYVQKSVETLAAKLILAGNVSTGDNIVIDCENNVLVAKASK